MKNIHSTAYQEFESSTTLLCRACKYGNYEIVKRSIANGADANNPSDSSEIPLEISIESKQTGVTSLLIARGAKLMSLVVQCFA